MNKLIKVGKIIISIIIVVIAIVLLYDYFDELSDEYLKKNELQLNREEIKELENYLNPLLIMDFVDNLSLKEENFRLDDKKYVYENTYKMILYPKQHLEYSFDELAQIDLYTDDLNLIREVLLANETKMKLDDLNALLNSIKNKQIEIYRRFGLEIRQYENSLLRIKRISN